MEKKRVGELLLRRKAFSLACDGRFQRTKSWAENAREVKSSAPNTFKAVVGTSTNPFGLPSLQDVLFEDGHAWPPGIGGHVPGTARSYARCAEPLFECSPEVILIDAYFSLRGPDGRGHPRQRRVLQAFLELANASPVCQSIRLVLKRSAIGLLESNEAQLEQDLEQMAQSLGGDKISITYQIGDDVGHGRYLLSVLGGLHFDQGFDEFEHKTNHVKWLSEPELKPLLERAK